MKKRGTALCVALALVVGLAPWLPVRAQSDSAQKTDGLGYIVKLRDDMPRLLSADTPGESLGLGMYRVDDLREIDPLMAAGAVEFVEPNYTYYLLAGNLVDDGYYRNDYQWNLDFMEMGPIWKDLGLTGQGVTVAVIDTGLAAHEDLPTERMLSGYNAVKREDGDAADIQGHGTFVSGIIAAEANNGKGVAGVAPKANILPCMVFREITTENEKSSIRASSADLIAAIKWATDQGADVINMSLGSTDSGYAVQEAVDYAVERGVIVVAAAGNDGDDRLNYPAANDKVIGVGALGETSGANEILTDSDKGKWAPYSNYNNSVFVTAPGTKMYSTVRVWGTEPSTFYAPPQSGTSCAAPCVSGLAALAKEYDRSIDNARFQNLLMLTADDRGDAGWDPKYGYGSVNAASMAAALPERTITYDLNGGDWQEGEPTPAQTAFRTYQEEPVTLPVPVREGYAFMGWYRAEDLLGVPESVLTLPALEEDVTYTAKWLDDDTALTWVTYTLNGREYTCLPDEGDGYRLYLPAGTDLTGGEVKAQAKSDSTEIYIMRADTDPERWTVRATPESGNVKTYQVTITVEDAPPDPPPVEPSPTPSAEPTPTVSPTPTPTPAATPTPSTAPTPPPSTKPTATPPATATPSPSAEPSQTPTPIPSPSAEPTQTPPPTSSAEPTETPSTQPSEAPSAEPSTEPSETPTEIPSAEPTETPTAEPSETPTAEPSETPSAKPSTEPSAEPTQSPSPSPAPSPTTRPSSGGSRRPGSTQAEPPATPAAPVPAVVTVREDGGARLEVQGGRALTQSERETVVRANAGGAVTVRGAGLRVVIPKGVARTESQVDDLMADVTQARAGDVVVRTDERGESHVVPLSIVEMGYVTYVADGAGRYTVQRGGATFADAADHWARDAITFSADRELTRGMSEDCFDPERRTTRAMVFTLLARLEGEKLPASQGGEWYDSAVTWAMSRGLSDGTRPQGDVTREELVTLLWREMGQPQADGNLEGFTDHWSVSPYARQAMVWAVKSGIISGRTDASIDPATGATRAETAVILQRFITYQLKQQLGE